MWCTVCCLFFRTSTSWPTQSWQTLTSTVSSSSVWIQPPRDGLLLLAISQQRQPICSWSVVTRSTWSANCAYQLPRFLMRVVLTTCAQPACMDFIVFVFCCCCCFRSACSSSPVLWCWDCCSFLFRKKEGETYMPLHALVWKWMC